MNNQSKGILMALVAAILWGISGTCGQFLFQRRGISVEWLMSVRMLGAGTLLLIAALLNKDQIWTIWNNNKDRRDILVFGIFGMLTVQYTYFAAIKHSNAATATILQFSAPVFIAVYLAVRYNQKLNLSGYIAILLALSGTFILVTHGNIYELNISPTALVLGIASAVSLAFYTLMPGTLLKKYSSRNVVGWALLIGGVTSSLVKAPWHADGNWDVYTYAGIFFIVVFGTLVPFYFYLQAVQYIGGQKASLLTSAEPLSATFVAVLWLGVSFKFMDWLGALLIITTVFLLSARKLSRGSNS